MHEKGEGDVQEVRVRAGLPDNKSPRPAIPSVMGGALERSAHTLHGGLVLAEPPRLSSGQCLSAFAGSNAVPSAGATSIGYPAAAFSQRANVRRGAANACLLRLAFEGWPEVRLFPLDYAEYRPIWVKLPRFQS